MVGAGSVRKVAVEARGGAGTPLKHCDCLSIDFFPCFFLDTIKYIYNKDASLSIHSKKYLFTSVDCASPAMLQVFMQGPESLAATLRVGGH